MTDNPGLKDKKNVFSLAIPLGIHIHPPMLCSFLKNPENTFRKEKQKDDFAPNQTSSAKLRDPEDRKGKR